MNIDNTHNTKPEPEFLKESFLKFVESKQTSSQLSKLNQDKDAGEFRIATYNIHYFTDIYESNNNYENILSDISNINADVIGLQEFILGNKVKINKRVVIDLTEFYDKIEQFGYTKTVLCNSVPSWFKSIYGNIVLVSSNVCVQSDDICKDISETIHTFDKSTKTVEVSGSHQGTNETRCYIKIKTSYNGKNIYIYTTHLDVASEELRTTQMQYIINDSKKHNGPDDVVFIMGDFNSFDVEDIATNQIYKDNWESNEFIKDNGNVVALLKKEGFTDCHRSNNMKMTAWNNTRVDFIFCNKIITGDFRAEYLYTANSDHLPVILTLTKNTVFVFNNVQKRSKRRRSLKSKRKSRSKKINISRRYKTTGSSLPPPSLPKVV
jgi:endonuclease/exonuclease/phosphatase family metal-dependent hydrolase